MKIHEAVITSDGDLRIPDEVRRTLGVEPSDTVRFVVDGGNVRLEAAKSSLRAGYGAVKPRNHPEDFAAIRSAMEEEIGESVANDPLSR